MSVTEIQLFRF